MTKKDPQHIQEQGHSFTAVVEIGRINPYVDVPQSAVSALGGGKKAEVLASVVWINDNESLSPHDVRKIKDAASLEAIGRLDPSGWFRTTLIPLCSEETRLYLDKWMRETANVEVGDPVQVTLKVDHGSRDLSVPSALSKVLESNPGANTTWQSLSPSRRRAILTYLNFLKAQDALELNVGKVIADLLKQAQNMIILV